MALLGGSPLGLIGVKSTARSTGMSYFNGGDSRNINVYNYNRGTDTYPIINLGDNKYGSVKTEEINEGTRSLFTGPTVISPYGNVGKLGTENGGGIGTDKYSGINRRQLHNDQIYDTSILNILEKLSGTEAALRPADFAYLKDVGVYPNNRLMIARRFVGPHQDNIFGKGKEGVPLPMAIMIGWKPQNEDFVSISFGEYWVDADADFKNVLNSLGNDFLGKTVGTKIGGGLGAVPLPGFTETLQRILFTKLGMMEDDPNVPLPSGNPNLIKEAKRRKTIGYEGAGSGLKCTVSIKFTCEWEQKFISGIDPTVVFQDILSKVATFGTSRSSNYGLSPKFQEKMELYVNKPSQMITDFIQYIKDGLNEVKSVVSGLINQKKSDGISEATTTAFNGLSDFIKNGAVINGKRYSVESVISRQIQKYKIELQGIGRALTGLPSTPWHVTIGNPLRPVFCSGDMYMEQDLVLTLGPTLAFNDLPSNIKAEFTLTNARPWGLQEILAKFNAGSIRVSTSIKDENDKNVGDTENALGKMNMGPVNQPIASGTQLSSNTNIANSVSQATTIPNVGAGPQPQEFPTLLNNYGQGAINNNLTAGASGALSNANSQLNNTQYEWSVMVDGSDRASGVANSLEEANRSINTFSTGGVIIDKTIVATAAKTTKEGSSGEQIIADANSVTPTTLQNIRFF